MPAINSITIIQADKVELIRFPMLEMEWNLKTSILNLRSIVYLIILFVTASCTLTFPTSFPRDETIDASLYVPDFNSILGDEWIVDDPIIPTVGDDYQGRPITLIYRVDVSAQHSKDSFPLIRYSVLFYDSLEAANERYDAQKTVLLSDDPRDNFTWYDIPVDALGSADRADASCLDTTTSGIGRILRCTGIFMYNQKIVVIRVRLINSDVRFLQDLELTEIFLEIDNLLGN